jgi:hypothetical protein
MSFQTALFLVTGGKALDLVKQHIAEVHRVRAANADAMRELGLPEGTQFRVSSHTYRLHSVRFPDGAVPAGWTRPSREHGVSRPKAGTEWAKRIAALPTVEDPAEVIGRELEVPLSMNYRHGTSCGWCAIGSPARPCGWCWLSDAGPYAMWVPDVPAAVQARQGEGYTIEEPAASFRLQFDGCRRILHEEWELLVARAQAGRAAQAEPVLV